MIEANAIIMGVKESWIKAYSLEPLHKGLYANRIEWMPRMEDEPKRQMILYNGNHHCYYMQSNSMRMQALTQYHHYRTELEKQSADSNVMTSLQNGIFEALRVVEKEGVWLVRFVDKGKCVPPPPIMLACYTHQLCPQTNWKLLRILSSFNTISMKTASSPAMTTQTTMNSYKS